MDDLLKGSLTIFSIIVMILLTIGLIAYLICAIWLGVNEVKATIEDNNEVVECNEIRD